MTPGFRSSALSVGVARQYSGALGKVGNCQIGVSVNAATEQASCPLIGGCSCRRSGMRTASQPGAAGEGQAARGRAPRREVAARAGDDRRAAGLGARRRRWSSATAPTATSPSSARAWRSATSATCSRSRASPRPTRRRHARASRRSAQGRGRPPGVRYRQDPSSLKRAGARRRRAVHA